MKTFKPGDKIKIFAGDYTYKDGKTIHYPEGEYILADSYTARDYPFFINLKTGKQGTRPVVCVDINAITEEEISHTHGIESFAWEAI